MTTTRRWFGWSVIGLTIAFWVGLEMSVEYMFGQHGTLFVAALLIVLFHKETERSTA